MFSDESILVFEEWGNRLETVEDATGDGVSGSTGMETRRQRKAVPPEVRNVYFPLFLLISQY